jgi:hypothetical protein
MCRGGRLVADFTAGAGARPGVPEELEEHLTVTADESWAVWAYKLARPQGELFIPLTGGPGYPADARAKCRLWDAHDAPDPQCSCGFHALSDRNLPGLPVPGPFAVLTVALSGRVLAFDWRGRGTLWRAERQTVIRVEQPDWSDQPTASDWAARYGWALRSGPAERVPRGRRRPDDPEGRLAVAAGAAPRGSGPVRLHLPVSAPVLPVSHDDAGWCLESGDSRPLERSPAGLVLA